MAVPMETARFTEHHDLHRLACKCVNSISSEVFTDHSSCSISRTMQTRHGGYLLRNEACSATISWTVYYTTSRQAQSLL